MASLPVEVFPSLNFLLKAKSKDFVRKIFHEAFRYRNEQVPLSIIKNITSSLEIETNEANELFDGASALVCAAVFDSLAEPRAVYELFPEDFHKNLRELISKIIAESMSSWKANATSEQVSLPKLVNFDWRVDVKTSSDTVGRMSMPTCMVQLQVQENPVLQDTIPELQSLNVELTKEKLDTMLDGLGKIRDQLSAVAK